MKPEDLKEIIQTMEKIDSESLNGDPMSFKGKIVVPFGKSQILKISSTFDANGELFIIKEARKRGITFYTPLEVAHQGVLSFLLQHRVDECDFSKYNPAPRETLNFWCPGTTEEERLISGLVFQQYGEKEWEKIHAFNEEFELGNIYFRNVGIDQRTGLIQCFDFQCGKARNEKGEYYV